MFLTNGKEKMYKSKNRTLRVGDLVRWAPFFQSNLNHNEIGVILGFVGPNIKRHQMLEVSVLFPSGIKRQYLSTTNIEEDHVPFIII
jgi:hypothetical protein